MRKWLAGLVGFLLTPALAACPAPAVADDGDGEWITAPGTFNDEIGCPADWDPACPEATLAYDPATGVYSAAFELPAGTYEFKIAAGGSWDDNWGADGVAGGANMAFEAEAGLTYVAFSPRSRRAAAGPAAVVAEVAASGLPGAGEARAIWLATGVIAWPPALGDAAGLRFELAGQPGIAVAFAGALDSALVAADPRVAGYQALAVTPTGPGAAGDPERFWNAVLAAGAVELSAYSGSGLAARTGVQLGGLIDDVFAAAADEALGTVWTDGTPELRLWAPTAASVNLLLWDDPAGEPERIAADWWKAGIWTVAGAADWKDREYLWEVAVYAPAAGAAVVNQVTDPYSAGLTVDSARSVLVDLADPAWMPELWAGSANPAPLRTQAAQTIYELHVRDFSAADQTVPAAWRGTYLAFTAFGSAGMAHLAELAEAGITTVHLLPTFDFTSVPEERADQAAGVIPDAPPDSAEQQAAVAAVADRDAFNWGYDPWHWGVPEGSYATAGNQSGGARTAEFRSMVGALHSLGLRVVLDQVFNHTAASGQWPNSVLDRIVPGYYHRLDASGTVQNSTCCDNVAVERAMAGKLVVDTVVSWAKNYHVDGFRFDIMGHHPLSNILAVRAALDALTLEADGVDGQAIYLYGEAWNFGEVADDALFTQATQAHLTGTGIGAFNDRLRDAVRGGGPFDTDQRTYQGFATGLYTDPNGMFAEVGEEQREELLLETNLVRLSLAGCLADFAFPAPGGGTVLGRDIDYGGQAAGFAAEPDECVNYVDAHDNETLFDNGIFKLPTATSMADRVRMNTLALATTALGQAPSFWHAGTEILRSKSGDRNSYNAGDHFNAIDWSLETNVFGTGLPMERDNAARWDILAPLLADPALKPGQADMEQAYAMALDLLRLRSSTPLFTLGSADLIRERVSFPAAGPDSRPGLLAMAVDDRAGLASGDVDPALDGLLVVFNASAGTITEPLEGLAGRAYTLHPVQRDGADPVVRETAWDAGSGTITIPARTVAVLVLEAGAEPVAVDPASRSAVPALAAAALTLAAAGLIAAFAARRRRA